MLTLSIMTILMTILTIIDDDYGCYCLCKKKDDDDDEEEE